MQTQFAPVELPHGALGGLDAHRVAFNDDHGRDLAPATRHFRSETIGLQRGEAEWRGGNLYFDPWDQDFQRRILPPATAART